jgi:tyrosine decarboxylase/aspartate 1-decarboxylase
MHRAEPQEFSRVLSSMCTEPHPAARETAERFLATNPGDPGTYEAVAELEERAVDLLGEVVGLDDPAGYVASGGTEANIQAVRIARNRAETDAPNVVAPESAHFSFRKAAEVLQVELRTAPLGPDYRADVDAMAHLVDRDTVAVVGVAGTTEYGRVDPIPAIADLAADADALCHVDAAWGGFVLPFTHHDWSFADAPIDTMTIDPHKMGQAAIPAGGLVGRSPELFDELAIDTPYLESTSQVTLTGTRSGAGVASTVAAMDELWPEGYRAAHERAAANAEWLTYALEDRDYDVVAPELPIVAAAVPDRAFEALRDRGWRISRTGADELRVVCMPHVTRPMLHSFVADLDLVDRATARSGPAAPAGVEGLPREHLD